jgi:decaprenylphospho-beta-D-ribofuranose 2-oxidase
MSKIFNFTNLAYLKKSQICKPKELHKLINTCKETHTIVGNHKSYGDCGIGSEKNISLRNFNKVINFDEKKKTIEVESGMLVKDLMEITLKKNLILKCLPGSKFISIGGMIATNVQGKCSKLNNIKYYIESLKIVNNKNKIINCSKYKNKKYFELTIGGFGFTGPILSAKFKLIKIQSHNILQSVNTFNSFDTFIKISKKNSEYSVAWLDFMEKQFTGILFNGVHSHKNKKIKYIKNYYLPKILIKILSILCRSIVFTNLFNKIFYYKNKIFPKKNLHIYDFFFPQDAILNYNKIFEKEGFIQIQFTLKMNEINKILEEFKNILKPYKIYSNFCIIKFLNIKKNKNLISLSLDFTIKNNFMEIKKNLNYLTNKFKLNVNLSKDLILEYYNNKIVNSNPILRESNYQFLSKKHTSQMMERIMRK